MNILSTFARKHSPEHGATPVTTLAVLTCGSKSPGADNDLTVYVGTFSLGDFSSDRAGYIQRGLAAFEHIAGNGVRQTLAGARRFFPSLTESEYRI